MPRKQNGWNNPANTGFKKFDANPQPKSAAGSYPSFRGYGSTVIRTVIEKWDLDSTWARWRKGMEYYYQAAWLPMLTENPNYDYSLPDQRDPTKPNYNPRFVTQELSTVLYQGTEVPIPITFQGYRFATRNADSKTHYVLKRTIDNNIVLGFVEEIYNNKNIDNDIYKDSYPNNEVWMKIVLGRFMLNDYALVRSEGERITNGEVSANILKVLTRDHRPAVYNGKSFKDGSRVEVEVPQESLLPTEFVVENGLEALVGKVVYINSFYAQQLIDENEKFTDFAEFMQVETLLKQSAIKVDILDPGINALPPSLYDIQNLEKIYSTYAGEATLTATHYIQKKDYQRFFGIQYLTAELMQSEVETIAIPILPFIVLGVRINKTNGKVVLESEPFQSSVQLFTPADTTRLLVLSDSSFTRQSIDVDAEGNYNHEREVPGEPLWQKLDIAVNPWMDETFVQSDRLSYGEIYSCSCPAYLHAKIRQPEVVDEEGKLINRQARMPLPTSQSQGFYESGGTLRVAGIIQSWASEKYKRDFKICKHTVAAMFINKIRVEEPNTLPSYETRLKFEEKLTADIEEVAQEFGEMLRRSEITTVELIYALADALSMDDVELGYLMQNANF